MSRKVCFVDEDGQVGTCTKDDENCATCTCIPKERLTNSIRLMDAILNPNLQKCQCGADTPCEEGDTLLQGQLCKAGFSSCYAVPGVTGEIKPEGDICGFSMGGLFLRKCIKDRCRFWISFEEEKKNMQLALDQGRIAQEEFNEFCVENTGFCVFEAL